MTWKQIGIAAGVAGVAVAAWLGIWNMVDRRFAEMRAEIRAEFSDIRTELRDLRTELRDVRGRLDDVAEDVNVLVGRQQERDRDPAVE